MRKSTKTPGFAMMEALIGALMLSIIGSGMAGLYIIESGLLSQTMHRLEAINYARASAELLLEAGRNRAIDPAAQGLLTLGTHSDDTICALPESYFRDHLEGRITYTVTDVSVEAPIKAIRADIAVTWKDKLPKSQARKETLTIIAYFYSAT